MLVGRLYRINWINCEMPYHNFNHDESQPSCMGCIYYISIVVCGMYQTVCEQTEDEHSIGWPWFSSKFMTKTDFLFCQFVSFLALFSHQSLVSCFKENQLKTVPSSSFSIQWEESEINPFVVRAESVEVGAFLSYFKGSSSFRRQRKIISVEEKRGWKRKDLVQSEEMFFKITEKGELQLDLCRKYTEQGIRKAVIQTHFWK